MTTAEHSHWNRLVVDCAALQGLVTLTAEQRRVVGILDNEFRRVRKANERYAKLARQLADVEDDK